MRTFRRRRPSEPLEEPHALVLQEAEEAESALSRNEIFTELSAALRRLQPDEQTLLVLRYLEEKPYQEIADIVRKRSGTVTMRTHRALRKLKRELTWHKDLDTAAAAAGKSGKPIVLIQALGDLKGYV